MQHKFFRAFLCLTSLLLSCTGYISCQPATAQLGEFTYNTLDIDFGNAIQFKNLKVIPISLKTNFETSKNNYGDYIPLSSAIESKKVEISERSMNTGSSDEVNKLFIENKSKDTVFLMAGEIVKGGKQDRTLATDVILPPGKMKYDIEVFCVEHGRWSSKDENRVAGKANEEMKFNSTAPVVKNSVRRMATLNKEQSKVWDEVTVTNQKASNSTNTDAYTSIESNVDYQKEEKEYRDHILPALKQNSRIIGFVAVTGNHVIGCDIFATHQLFSSTVASVLPSYINEAVHDGAVVTIGQAGIKSYLDKLLNNQKSQDEYMKENGKMFKDRERPLHLNSY